MALLSLVFMLTQTAIAATIDKKPVITVNSTKTSDVQTNPNNPIKNEIAKLKTAFKSRLSQSKENQEKHRNMRNELISQKMEDRIKIEGASVSVLTAYTRRPTNPLLIRVENMRKIADRLDIRIQKNEDGDIDLTDARIALAIADVKIDDAEADIETIVDETDTETPKASTSKDIYDNARKSMKEAQKSLTDVVEIINSITLDTQDEKESPAKVPAQ